MSLRYCSVGVALVMNIAGLCVPDSDSSRCLAAGSSGSIEQANYRAGLGATNLERVAGGHLSRAFDNLAVLGAHSHATVNTSTDGWIVDTTLSMLVTVHAYPLTVGLLKATRRRPALYTPKRPTKGINLIGHPETISLCQMARSLASCSRARRGKRPLFASRCNLSARPGNTI